jgi:glyoxylate/hydroxypyruvate/2-ketogluconate reductase
LTTIALPLSACIPYKISSLHKPKLLVARATFPAVLDKLATHFDVHPNQDDFVYSRGQLLEKLQGCQAALPAAVSGLTRSFLRPVRD